MPSTAILRYLEHRDLTSSGKNSENFVDIGLN